MTYLRIKALLVLAAAFLGACSTPVNQGDSETHWIVCNTDSECGPSETCEQKHCVGAGAKVDTGGPKTPDGGPPRHITNATGTCVAPNNGARPGYQSPDPGDVWLPDCKNTLKREYWRVFAKSETSAYVIPRPDGARELTASVCRTETHPLYALVQKYSLCAAATTPDAGARINDMLPADALAITHYLHTQLLFEQVEGIPDRSVSPFPIPSDVLDACALHPDQNSAEFKTDCESEQHYVASGLDLAPSFYSTAVELAGRLNELYGIGADCAAGEKKTWVCLECGVVGGCGKSEVLCTRTCKAASECVGAPAGDQCNGGVCSPASGSFCI